MERLRYSRTIPGTQSFHSFIPNSITSVEMKPYSKSTTKHGYLCICRSGGSTTVNSESLCLLHMKKIAGLDKL